MKHKVTLDYTLGTGWLAPWIDGVRTGKAIASVCGTCDCAAFPPLRFCPSCNKASDGWRTLSGGADILARTVGTDGDFALARFDGAASAAIVRTDMIPEHATRGALMAVPDGPPQLRLEPEAKG